MRPSVVASIRMALIDWRRWERVAVGLVSHGGAVPAAESAEMIVERHRWR